MTQIEVPEAAAMWQSALVALRDHLPEQSFATWLRPLVPERFENNALILTAPSQFHREWIESHYVANLETILADLRGEQVRLKLQVSVSPPVAVARPAPPPPLPAAVSENQEDSHLNPRYLFENFIEGDSNSFARAACLAVADMERRCPWNPLLIYGGTGLGKTHLLQAIGNRALSRHRGKYRVLYASSERFTQDFIHSLQTRHTTDFSHRYRSIDLLLVDDVQFFAAKERTQIEFFHAFNTLYQKGKRIVLTADRPVSELADFDKRLVSRFDSGLVTNIEPPDYETRVAILLHRAEADKFPMTRDVADFLAATITSNIRELEGAYVTLTARCQLMRVPPSADLVREILKTRSGQNGHRPPAEHILTIVAEFFSISPDLLRGKSRKKEIVLPRMIAMMLMTECTSLSLKQIGSLFGGRDHSTVIHARDTIRERHAANDAEIVSILRDLRNKINPLTPASG
ncbi:MAG: chromosomal replication initiator protein DnaA [bacterium]|nr:chromosomal replication initiator protein DnaA [bacterium]